MTISGDLLYFGQLLKAFVNNWFVNNAFVDNGFDNDTFVDNGFVNDAFVDNSFVETSVAQLFTVSVLL